MNSFDVMDCALLVRMSGLPSAINLREMRERVAACSPNVLYHHFCETPLNPRFGNIDYRNDFGRWIQNYLGDKALAEQVGMLDPFAYPSMEDLRADLLLLLDDRLGDLTVIENVSSGNEFYFMEATTMVFDTEIRIRHPRELGTAIDRMTVGSIYFHFLEARRRPPFGMDDFTAWLRESGGEWEGYIRALASVDFYFHTLSHLRAELVRLLSNAEGEIQ